MSPFIIENQLQNIPGVKTGTLLTINDKLVLVVAAEVNKQDLAQYLENIPYEELKIIPKMPMDPRHYSKIDYGKLKAIIANTPHPTTA